MDAAQMIETVGAIKAKIDSGDLISKEAHDAAIADLKTAIRKDTEARVNLANSRSLGDDDRKLSKYLPSEADIKQGRKQAGARKSPFYQGKGGPVQLAFAEYGPDGLEGDSYGLLDDPNPVCDWQRELQGLVTQRNLVRAIRGDSRISDRQIGRHMRSAPDMVAKIFADSSAVGAEWVDDTLSPDLKRTMVLARNVEALFPRINVGATGDYKYPFLTTGARPYLAAANVIDDPAQYTASTPVTADRTFTVKKLATRIVVDEDSAEDALINSMTLLNQMIAESLTDGIEDCIVNGDTTATHQDTIAAWNTRSRWGATGLGGTGDHRRAWIGLRARAEDVTNSTDQTAAQTAAGLLTAIGNLGAPHFQSEVVILVSPEYALKMLGFTEALTVDKFGPAATIHTGQIASLYGFPIVVSEFLTPDLNASGIYDDTTKTKTGMLLFNRSRFNMFDKRGSRVRMAADITRGTVNLVGDVRTLFGTFDSSTEKNVHWSYNLTP